MSCQANALTTVLTRNENRVARNENRLCRVVLFAPFNVNNTVAMATGPTGVVTMGTGILKVIRKYQQTSLKVAKVRMTALQLCAHNVFYEGAHCRVDTA
eukprot:sb/3478821/